MKRGVVHRLQLFHTGNPQLKWGLRTLDDIPMGTFVCSYVGHVYTEMSAEMVPQNTQVAKEKLFLKLSS